MSHWEIWLCDPEGVRLACLDRTAGFAVSRVANGIGACAIVLPDYYDDMVKLDYILEFWRKPNGGALKFFGAYFMRRWRYDDDSGTTGVWGYDGNYLAQGRIVAYDAASAQSLQTDYLDDMMKVMIIDAIGADAGTDRILTSVGGGVTIAAELGAAPSATKGFSWRNVHDVLLDLAAASKKAGTNLYFDMVPSFTSTGKIAWTFRTFTGQRGADHTSDSSNPLHFGAAWGNLSGGYYEIDHSSEWNYVYGRGQGTKDTRYTGNAYDATRYGASIWNRREEYCNAAAGGEGASDAATLADAEARLEQGRPKWRAGGAILDTPQARYDVDFGFGDTISVDIRGKQVDAEISAVAFSVDDSGRESAEFRFEVEGA